MSAEQAEFWKAECLKVTKFANELILAQRASANLREAAVLYMMARAKHAKVRAERGLKPAIKWWGVREQARKALWQAVEEYAQAHG